MPEITWSLGVYPIKSLKPHEKNPRYLTKNQKLHLTESMAKFGLIDKPIINRDLTIIGGHQRISILKESKQKTVECWIPSIMLDKNEVDELCIRLNKNTGDWNYDTLANEWDLNDLIDWGFDDKDILGIAEHEIEKQETQKDNENGEKTDAEKSSDDKKEKKITCPSCGHKFQE